ncbi:pyruvate, water dikinase regulatory protein [Mycobacterium sp. pUA109]|uniref:posphoenolpyruvate synthetase regulatory kinase/phosphorylase PpsR n=1 Tax=Mycobacterium sp. pUA109 TaxID=3238982 RepID=UPI00351B4937
MRRPVFFISDSTGITAETIGNSMLAQFEGVEFEKHRLPFIDDATKAESAAQRIKTRYQQTGSRPIVVNTMADRSLGGIVAASGALMLDVFAPFIGRLEEELGATPSGAVNRSHGLVDVEKYEARMNATNYALAHDDGMDVDFSQADLILVGVSRSGKTPTCLYMALHYGVSAANYPLIDEDLDKLELPVHLRPYRDRLCGLAIDPQRLAQIREQRRPGSRYAAMEQCRWELEQAERLMRREGIPYLNTTHVSIEEIASKIFDRFGIERTMF